MNEGHASPQPANRDTAAAWAYHAGTNHSLQSVRADHHQLEWANQPRPYKLYVDLPARQLEPSAGDSGIPALAAIAATGAGGDAVRVPDLPTLAAILHYSAGITKRLRFPGGVMDFRAAACTGALYHIELYLVCGDLPGLEAGVYHFGAHDGSLRRLRDGDHRAALVQATGGEPAVAEAPAVIVYTSTFWRNAWKYQARAYRHAFWDSGTIIANTLALAAAHDLPARVVTGFVDREVNLLLDLDPQREAALALVPLGRDPGLPLPPAPAIASLGLETAPYSRHEVDYPQIHRMHAASSLGSAEEVRAWRDGRLPHAASAPQGELVLLFPLDPSALPLAPIERVIQRRGSSRRFAETPVPAAALATMLTAATRGVPADYLEAGSQALAEPYLIVNRVEGLPPGAYRFHPDTQALEFLKTGDFSEEARYLDLGQDLAADAAVDIYFLADLNAILESLGNRGYRAAQLDAAITAGKMYLAAYALGLGATGLTFFDDDVIEFFSPSARGKSVMFLIALGAPLARRP